jgi:5-methyltetrahydropteroyltriglutamate--homocysteine methyltransferase
MKGVSRSVKTTVVGAFPKISDQPGGQELRQALHKQDRGELSEKDLDAVYDQVTAGAITELEAAGINVINDGQIRWDDLLAPFANAWQGVKRGPLERFYDNNTYFRQPTIEGPIKSDGKTLVRSFTYARSVATGDLKAAVAGPMTFATLAIDKHYRSLDDRVLAVADAIAAEVKALGAAGATLVDVEDPGLVYAPQHIEVAREAYKRIAAAGVPIAVQAYFFPADRILEVLASFPVAQIGVDVRSRETTALGRLDVFKGKTVVLGIVDARNTRLETASELGKLVDEALKLVKSDDLWLSTTTGLEYLPHDVATKKLTALAKAARGGVPA